MRPFSIRHRYLENAGGYGEGFLAVSSINEKRACVTAHSLGLIQTATLPCDRSIKNLS